MTSVKAWPLLLLPFSLVSMGKECPFPVLSGTVVLSSASILKNSFSDNSEAFVECAKGYTRDKGPTSISCVNGVWSPVELICKKIDCGQPKLLPHMTYSIPDGTLFGAYIQPKCETGYDLEGSSYRQCLVTGWSGKAECILTECEYPDPIENGKMVAPRQPVFNDVITYSCDDNYTLVGNSSITCGEYGEYSSPRPKCIAIECSVPEVRFGNRTEGNPPFFYKSEATFECWPGYSMKGLATSVCEKSGWSALPVCDEVIITPTKASTTTNIATTTDMTTASTRSHGGLGAKLHYNTNKIKHYHKQSHNRHDNSLHPITWRTWSQPVCRCLNSWYNRCLCRCLNSWYNHCLCRCVSRCYNRCLRVFCSSFKTHRGKQSDGSFALVLFLHMDSFKCFFFFFFCIL
ncbi:membrane cofactor protein-like isoform X2 [Cyprinus carpio]|uniref:Membrane cofactor protein-like isoform X2 n=1 Tax=Cyprinus carpio TaxID=7962 RepID=A0A9R0A298_CYPCA|nr:membrane cofactor protein-like isoform X2 [Cyprinus carpio]